MFFMPLKRLPSYAGAHATAKSTGQPPYKHRYAAEHRQAAQPQENACVNICSLFSAPQKVMPFLPKENGWRRHDACNCCRKVLPCTVFQPQNAAKKPYLCPGEGVFAAPASVVCRSTKPLLPCKQAFLYTKTCGKRRTKRCRRGTSSRQYIEIQYHTQNLTRIRKLRQNTSRHGISAFSALTVC